MLNIQSYLWNKFKIMTLINLQNAVFQGDHSFMCNILLRLLCSQHKKLNHTLHCLHHGTVFCLIEVISLFVYEAFIELLCKFSWLFGLQLVFLAHPAILTCFFFQEVNFLPFLKVLKFLLVQFILIIWIAIFLSLVCLPVSQAQSWFK